MVGYANIAGLNVNKDIKNVVDIYRPVCKISVRLFNGEIIKADFNYIQTLRDIYFYVGKISGSINFTLLDGFPPRTLTDYNRTIGELKLENSILIYIYKYYSQVRPELSPPKLSIYQVLK